MTDQRFTEQSLENMRKVLGMAAANLDAQLLAIMEAVGADGPTPPPPPLMVGGGSSLYNSMLYNAAVESMDVANRACLINIRKWVIEETGRYDLVVDAVGNNYSDAGVDKYINEGIKWLERNLPGGNKTDSWMFHTLPAGTAVIRLTRARVVREVWLAHEDGKPRCPLKLVGPNELMRWFGGPEPPHVDDGPLCWSPLVGALAPEQELLTKQQMDDAGLTDNQHIIFENTPDLHYPYRHIGLGPVVSQDRQVLVLGKFQSKYLSDDCDVNWWTMEEPGLVVRATAMQMEIGHRNTQGVQDYETPLRDELRQIYHDLVEQETQGPPEMWRMEPV